MISEALSVSQFFCNKKYVLVRPVPWVDTFTRKLTSIHFSTTFSIGNGLYHGLVTSLVHTLSLLCGAVTQET